MSAPVARVLGHDFFEMSDSDWESLAGAELGTLICYTSDHILLWDPTNRVLSEVDEEGHQVDWSPMEIN